MEGVLFTFVKLPTTYAKSLTGKAVSSGKIFSEKAKKLLTFEKHCDILLFNDVTLFLAC
jgi:hypothetical protein